MCKCAEPKVKQERVFDILNRVTGNYLYDVPESKLSETIQRLREIGCEVQDLRITQEVFVQPVWVINE